MWTAKLKPILGEKVVKYSPSTVIHRLGRVYDCDLSSNGAIAISASGRSSSPCPSSGLYSQGALVSNATTGATISKLVLDGHEPITCALSSNGQLSITGDINGDLIWWDNSSGSLLTTSAGHKRCVRDAAFSSYEHKLATASDDNTACVWEAGEQLGRLCSILPHRGCVGGVDIAADARILYTSCNDSIVRGWDLRCSQEAFGLVGHTYIALDCASSRDGTLVVSCSDDGTVRLWDVRTLKESMRKHISGWVKSCDIDSDGRLIAACADNGKVFLFDIQNPKRTSALGGNKQHVASCAVSDNGDRVVVGCIDKAVHIYNICSRDSNDIPVLPETNILPDSFPKQVEANVIELSPSRHNVEIEKLFTIAMEARAVNDGFLTAQNFVNAISDGIGRSNVSSLLDVFRAHVILRTLLDAGITFTHHELGEAPLQSSFFYDAIYARLCCVVKSAYEKELALRLMNDAVQHGIMTIADSNSILVGLHVINEMQARSQIMENAIARMHASITSSINDLESRMEHAVEALQELRMEGNRRQRVSLISGWIKLGLSLVPVLGPVVMSLAGLVGEVLLSFSPKDLVEMCVSLAGGVLETSESQVGNSRTQDFNSKLGCKREYDMANVPQSEYAVRLVQVAFSGAFLGSLPFAERQGLVSAVTEHYQTSLEEMRLEVHAALEELRRRRIEQPQSQASVNTGSSSTIGIAKVHSGNLFAQNLNSDSEGNLPNESLQAIRSSPCDTQEARAPQHEDNKAVASFAQSDLVAGLSKISLLSSNGLAMNVTQTMSVEEVSDVMCRYVCDPLPEEMGKTMRARIQRNIRERALSGRGILSRHISEEHVAQCVLYEDIEIKKNDELSKDFMLLELLDFIRAIRSNSLNGGGVTET